MAARLASQRGARIILRNRRDLLRQVRCMSSAGTVVGPEVVYHEQGDTDAQKVWPDLELMTLHPHDQKRFPLPGNAGPGLFHTGQQPPHTKQSVTGVDPNSIGFLTEPTRHEQQANVINQFHVSAEEMEHQAKVQSANLSQADVELKIQDCPKLMRKDFQLLFPGSDVMVGDFTVVSLSQKTKNDMSGWSHAVEEEREALMALYTETANEICTALRNAGYWADFIDPSSGKPHIGPYTTDTMFETDERYRHFGFEIEDLGCCKVIKHQRWGTQAFIGCIFTNAPSTASVLVDLADFTSTPSTSA